jgi:hypothetical protein
MLARQSIIRLGDIARVTRGPANGAVGDVGGLATVPTGVIAEAFGPATGGLFLALPAIFCASATLIEKHERDRKEKARLPGRRRGQQAAALDAMGAAIGSFGLLGFAAIMWKLPDRVEPLPAFVAAAAVWLLVSVSLWWAWRHVRRSSF